MSNPSLQRFHPKADETFTFEPENLVTSMSHGLMDASFQDCVNGIAILNDSLVSKFKEFVATIDNCKYVSFGDEAGGFNLKLKRFNGDTTSVFIGPFWYQYTLETMEAYKGKEVDLTFVPGSFTEAVNHFIEIAYKSEICKREVDLCRRVSIMGGSAISLTPETAVRYLSAPRVLASLSAWCGVMWKVLSNGLSIEQAHYFALMSHLTHSNRIKGSQKKWRYRQKPPTPLRHRYTLPRG